MIERLAKMDIQGDWEDDDDARPHDKLMQRLRSFAHVPQKDVKQPRGSVDTSESQGDFISDLEFDESVICPRAPSDGDADETAPEIMLFDESTETPVVDLPASALRIAAIEYILTPIEICRARQKQRIVRVCPHTPVCNAQPLSLFSA
jgi:hypothetical protein